MNASATVTLPRAEYERILDALEDAEDRATLAAASEREARSGRREARKDHLPVELVERLFAGESAIRVWREHRLLSTTDLALSAGLTLEELEAIEAGTAAPGSDTVTRLAEALEVPADELAATP